MFPRSAKVGEEGIRFSELLSGVEDENVPQVLIEAFAAFTEAGAS